MSNSYNIYDIDALVMLNVIKANTVCVKVYLLFLTCSMTNPSKKKLTNRNEEGLLCWIISPNTEPQLVHSSMHTVKIIFIQTTLLNIDIWCRSCRCFFFNNTFFLTVTSNFTATLYFPQVSFYWILISITQNCHWNLEAASLVPSDQAAIVCINLMMV